MDDSNNKLMILLNELIKPILIVLSFVKEIIKHIVDLFNLAWKSVCSAMNWNILIPSFISVSIIFLILNTYSLIDSWTMIIAEGGEPAIDAISGEASGEGSETISQHKAEGIKPLFYILTILPIAWGFSVIAFVKRARDRGEDDNWRLHVQSGFKSIKFFLTYCVFLLALVGIMGGLSFSGLIPGAGQTLLAILSTPFFFLGITIALCGIGLFLGSILFGGYYLSDDYDESAGFFDRTKSLIMMVGRKIIDWISVSIPGFIIAFLFALIPLLLTYIALEEIVRKPIQGNTGQIFPGLVIDVAEDTDDDEKKKQGLRKFKDRPLSGYFSTDGHNRYPEQDVIKFYQQKFNQKQYQIDTNQKKYDDIIAYTKAINSLPGEIRGDGAEVKDSQSRINSVNTMIGQGLTEHEGIKLEDLLKAAGQGTYDNWLDYDKAQIQEELIGDFEWESFQEAKWSFDESGNLSVADSTDSFIGEYWDLRSDSLFFYSSEYLKEKDEFLEGINTWVSGTDNKVKNVEGHDSPFFIKITEVVLVISDALILAFPFAFIYGGLGSTYYRMYNFKFRANFFQKFIALIVLIVFVDTVSQYYNNNKEKIISPIVDILGRFSGSIPEEDVFDEISPDLESPEDSFDDESESWD